MPGVTSNSQLEVSAIAGFGVVGSVVVEKWVVAPTIAIRHHASRFSVIAVVGARESRDDVGSAVEFA